MKKATNTETSAANLTPHNYSNRFTPTMMETRPNDQPILVTNATSSMIAANTNGRTWIKNLKGAPSSTSPERVQFNMVTQIMEEQEQRTFEYIRSRLKLDMNGVSNVADAVSGIFANSLSREQIHGNNVHNGVTSFSPDSRPLNDTAPLCSPEVCCEKLLEILDTLKD